jgi:hypothetical protein
MNDSLQTINAPNDAWMTQEDGEDQIRLIGNRPAFEALRTAIDRLLSGEAENVWIEGEDAHIASIALQDLQDEVPPTPLMHKILICSILALFALILLLGLGTFIECVGSLFS